MSKSGKYQIEVAQVGNTWQALIKRQVTSRKTVISKQEDGFASEAEAQNWAEQQLVEFTGKQKNANLRQNQSRKQHEKTRSERSARRSEKTAEKKKSDAAKLANEQE